MSVEQKLTREKFEDIVRASKFNRIANASKEELDGLYDEIIKLFKVLYESPSVEDENFENEEDEDLSSCEQCGENAWDGYICHSCGMKEI